MSKKSSVPAARGAGPALETEAAGQASTTDRRLLDRMASPDLPHATCLRAFRRLWQTDPAPRAAPPTSGRAFATS
jgi:hypothetical protein